MKKQYSKEEMLEIIKEVNDKYGYVSLKNIDDFGKCRSHMYRRKFKSLDEALELSGIDVEENKLKRNEISYKNLNQKYTDDYLLQRLKDYVIEFNKIPTTREIGDNPNYPNDETYRERFGNFKNALIKSNIEIPQDKQWLFEREEYSKEELLNKLKEQTNIYLKTNLYLLNGNDINSIKNMPSIDTYCNKFGSLKNAYLEIGINYDEFNDKQLKEDMKQKYIEIRNIIGRTPSSRDLEEFSRKNDNYYYSCSAYQNHFGSLIDFQITMGDKPAILNNTTMGLRLITPNGNIALSKLEYNFLLMLEQYNIEFKKEEYYRDYINDFNRRYRFDFILNINNNTYFIEIFGMKGRKEYDKKTENKINICKANNIPLIDLYRKDIEYKNTEEIYKTMLDKIFQLSNETLRNDYNKAML